MIEKCQPVNEGCQNLGAFLRKAEAVHIEDKGRLARLSLISEIVQYIFKSPEGWDERCLFNIEHIGDQFIESLQTFNPSKATNIDILYCMSYRFLCEFDFLIGAGKELSIELRSIKRKIQHDTYEMDEDTHSQIVYASFIMPANIAKSFINNSDIGVFRIFEKTKSEAEKLKIDWDKEIENKGIEVNNLKSKLEEYKIGFNFVGLHKGFSNLSIQKDKEIFWLFWSLITMGVLVLAPLVTELLVATGILTFKEPFDITILLNILPIVSIEIILIYFFRIILFNYRSVKAQKSQIELRQTLCQFIQSYAEYSAKIKNMTILYWINLKT